MSITVTRVCRDTYASVRDENNACGGGGGGQLRIDIYPHRGTPHAPNIPIATPRNTPCSQYPNSNTPYRAKYMSGPGPPPRPSSPINCCPHTMVRAFPAQGERMVRTCGRGPPLHSSQLIAHTLPLVRSRLASTTHHTRRPHSLYCTLCTRITLRGTATHR